MTENPHMHLPQRARPFEWNLNTILGLVTLVTVILTGGYWLNDNDRDIAAIQEWIGEHEGVSRERRGEVEGDLSRVATQVVTLDDRLDVEEATVSRISDRVSAAEARSAEVAATIRELQTSINQQSGDLKVILAWIDEQRRQTEKPR